VDGAASYEDVVYHRVEAHAVRRDDGVCATESDRKSDDDTRDTWEGGGVRRERGIRDVGQWEEKLFTGLCQGEALDPSSGLSLAWLQPFPGLRTPLTSVYYKYGERAPNGTP
jgi:hypothetical protein